MDDLEGGANPQWDDDWRHTYATGLVVCLLTSVFHGTCTHVCAILDQVTS